MTTSPPVARAQLRTGSLSNLFLMRALGATRRTIACRFGLTESDVRALLAVWGEPARLRARRWRMEFRAGPAEIEAEASDGAGPR